MSRNVVVLILFISAAMAAPLPPGAIHGRVVEAKSGEPVKKAVVIIRHAQEPGLGVMTDASGEFQFDAVKPGVWTITAEHSGFVIDPESKQIVVNVSSENKAEITVKLIRTAAISGRVFDEDGDPVAGASVQIVLANQRKNSGPVASTVTNDRGEYRAFNVQPGKYRIAVSYTAPVEQMRVKMKAASGIYPTTFYPAAVDPRLGQVVSVEAGADLGGFDVQIFRAHAVTVKGTVTTISGMPPAYVWVHLFPVPQAISPRSLSEVIQDGRGIFEIGHVPPGRYIVEATAISADQNLSAHRAIEVGNTDVEGIQLALAQPQTVTGVFVLPEGQKIPPRLIVALEPQDLDYSRGLQIIQANPDGSFQIRGVTPGDYDVVADGHDDLYVSDIRAGDQDAFSGIHVGGQPVGPLKIVLKGNGGRVQVSVKDADGKPQPNGQVKIVPDPPRRTQTTLYSNCVTDASGTCTMLGIAPGAYRVFAFPQNRMVDFRLRDEIDDIEDSGTPFTIAEGEKRQLEINPIADGKPI